MSSYYAHLRKVGRVIIYKDDDGNLLWDFKSINGNRLNNSVWEL